MKQFLCAAFGQEQGIVLYGAARKKLEALSVDGKSANQTKTLKKTILPRIALYQVMAETQGQQRAYALLRNYMHQVVGPKRGKLYRCLELLPGFFGLFRKALRYGVGKNDAWDAEFTRDDKSGVGFNITRCLWLDACKENGCEALCQVFCETDDVIYGCMKNVVFQRKGTLAQGNPCCDFHYRKAKRDTQ